MATNTAQIPQTHSSAWVAQTWISFALSVGVTAMGIWFLPVDPWIKAFMAMGLLFSARIDEARFHRLIQEHDPLSPPA